MAKIQKRQSLTEQSVDMRFDMKMVTMLYQYSICQHTTRQQIAALSRLLKILNLEAYNYMPDIQNMLYIIRSICNAKLEKSLTNIDLIRECVSEENKEQTTLIAELNWNVNQIENAECRFLEELINERLQYLFLFRSKPKLIDLLNQIDRAEFISYYEVITELKQELSTLMANLQSTSTTNGVVRQFSFSEEEIFKQLMDVIVSRAKQPSAILQTGIRQLNAILAPGFHSGKLYCFLGPTGKFKSGTLLNIADQIRKYNPQIQPVENGKRKTILFITMENTIDETILRLFDMYASTDIDIRETTVEEVIRVLKDRGNYSFTNDAGIDIDIRYYNNLEITTGEIYSIVRELHDRGKDVMCIILDYIKRIDSVKDHYGDERIRIANSARELKNIAVNLNVPLITAMQINRDGNSIIEAAMKENKSDVARFIGASNVANSWDLIEECDWVGVINLERHKRSGNTYLTMKRLKIRGKKDLLASEYFNHPFADNKEIRLETDVDKPYSASIISLSNDLESVEEVELLMDEKNTSVRYPDAPTKNGKRKDNVLESIQMNSKHRIDPLTMNAIAQ